jgi:hypothetical protein
MTSVASSAVPPWKARLPWVLLAITVLFVAAMVPLSLGNEPIFDTVFFGLIALGLSTMGALIATRQPGNAIGWIFCAQGVTNGLLEMWGEGLRYHDVPTALAGYWIINWWWVVDLVAYALVFLLFPTGRLLSPRWRWVLWLLAVGLVIAIPGQSLTTDIADNPIQVDSPVIELMFTIGMFLLLCGLGASVTALVIRFRRSTGLERLQLKQLVFAASSILPMGILAIPFYYDSVLVQIGSGAALLTVPVAAGLAVLRYRLYDIDVVINRALVYGALTATLVGTYLGSVLVLQVALGAFIEGSSLAVAVSTLAVAALFRPARARIQDVVDRRFFRRKYDAARTLERFSSQMRDQVDLADIGTELLGVVTETVQPAHASLWLRTQDVRP